jgi:hypothetical protein
VAQPCCSLHSCSAPVQQQLVVAVNVAPMATTRPLQPRSTMGRGQSTLGLQYTRTRLRSTDATRVDGIASHTTEARGGISTGRGEAMATPAITVEGAAAIGGDNEQRTALRSAHHRQSAAAILVGALQGGTTRLERWGWRRGSDPACSRSVVRMTARHAISVIHWPASAASRSDIIHRTVAGKRQVQGTAAGIVGPCGRQ